MMADNIEHVISYWVVFQKFHSPALAGFAVVSHWLPFLLFSVASGALADRFDPRRLIQIGMALFIIASLSWSYFFITDTLEMWHAMVILVIHGCAGVLWQTPNQMLLYDIVGPKDLESAVRLNAMARYLGVLIGPAVGGAILLLLGPAPGILLNTVFYLPLVLWLVSAPYGPRFRAGAPPPRRAVRGFGDIVQTMRDIKRSFRHRLDDVAGRRGVVLCRQRLWRADAGFCQRPRPWRSRPVLQHAAGRRRRRRLAGWYRARRRTAGCRRGRAPRSCSPCSGVRHSRSSRWQTIMCWRSASCSSRVFCELSFNAMAQSLVQLNAPLDKRGRVIGLFNMASLGLRAFSGISVGLLGSFIGVHWSLGLSALATLAVATALLALP